MVAWSLYRSYTSADTFLSVLRASASLIFRRSGSLMSSVDGGGDESQSMITGKIGYYGFRVTVNVSRPNTDCERARLLSKLGKCLLQLFSIWTAISIILSYNATLAWCNELFCRCFALPVIGIDQKKSTAGYLAVASTVNCDLFSSVTWLLSAILQVHLQGLIMVSCTPQ